MCILKFGNVWFLMKLRINLYYLYMKMSLNVKEILKIVFKDVCVMYELWMKLWLLIVKEEILLSFFLRFYKVI